MLLVLNGNFILENEIDLENEVIYLEKIDRNQVNLVAGIDWKGR